MERQTTGGWRSLLRPFPRPAAASSAPEMDVNVLLATKKEQNKWMTNNRLCCYLVLPLAILDTLVVPFTRKGNSCVQGHPRRWEEVVEDVVHLLPQQKDL
jgi:hypothetical protein